MSNNIADYKALYYELKAEHLETIKAIKHTKAEAYTEFAEELKESIASLGFWPEYECVFTIVLDNLLKEKVGDKQ